MCRSCSQPGPLGPICTTRDWVSLAAYMLTTIDAQQFRIVAYQIEDKQTGRAPAARDPNVHDPQSTQCIHLRPVGLLQERAVIMVSVGMNIGIGKHHRGHGKVRNRPLRFDQSGKFIAFHIDTEKNARKVHRQVAHVITGLV
ncbi:hypothetical protein M5D96_009424 [Drosophila gunungcola]|uniref:Uncharacterized protein n=1 Tax=Drosophila gunungcola TaxID=103775 RepID=A0A9P9YJ59_9MUSC|nr:hypothetical protein M5D96_009424 [Drosophila gunungcola]